MDDSLLEKYARLIVKSGLNLQKNQILVISCPIEGAEFARKVAEIAFKEGAEDVIMNWGDEKLSKIRYLYAPERVFEEFPEWRKQFYLSYAGKGAAFLSIAASDPELMKEVDPDRLAKASKTSNIALKEYSERIMSNQNTWCVVSIPTEAWAKKVFPECSKEDAEEKLWETIFKTVRVDQEDPVAAWKEHKNNLKKRMEFLNQHQFKTLHYKNSLGTDLMVELPEGHLWSGGSDTTPEGLEFIANIPTEEVYTLPKKTGVNGKVISTKPLNYNGNLIDEFTLVFKEGKVIDFSAKKGYETLKNLLETDSGACYLGEVALVPYDSPISQSGILFYNTLFDENASCHLAFGKAYPTCLKEGEKMNQEELEKAGVNNSLIHVDFMVGSKDLQIIGTNSKGEEIQIFRDGNFAFE
ncbi:aminopeptidase [Garciella nitratireducens]|uniref:Leucyl aminopeptidase (Aminopeptidase T) n=1 Tax=Garciella nitratireducens DSM 15102 TaxID=1121911 RepID=A0A1T4M8F5_9FIRM|nr:aminopeptidase [Garciella nitratireducens]SJZ63191.1 Leucyl aminopeptidase (aminopeptidase T) [Garciella nitratireducens DSM 15102]